MTTVRGSVHQRHTRDCPRATSGRGYAPHKCHGPWAWHLDLGSDPAGGKRRQATKSGFARMRDAQVSLEEARARFAVTRGRGEGLTVGAWLDQWDCCTSR